MSDSGIPLCNIYPDAFCLERGRSLTVTAQQSEVFGGAVSHMYMLSAVSGGTDLSVRVTGLSSDDIRTVSISDPGSLLDMSGTSKYVRYPDGALGAQRRVASTSDIFITVKLKAAAVGKRYTISVN